MLKIINFYPDKPNGKSVETINPEKLPLPPGFSIEKVHFSYLSPGSWAGNHKHSRIELFVSYDALHLFWLDEEGNKHEEVMGRGEGESIKIFVVESQTPHLIINKGATAATYVELCNGKLNDVAEMDLLE